MYPDNLPAYHSGNLPSLLSSGRGTSRATEQEPDSVESDEDIPEYDEQEVDGDDEEWSDKPTYAQQLVEYPSTCKVCKPQIRIFDLLNKEELNRYNSTLAMSDPPEAPSAIIVEDKVHDPSAAGKWLAMVRYRRVLYKKLIKRTQT